MGLALRCAQRLAWGQQQGQWGLGNHPPVFEVETDLPGASKPRSWMLEGMERSLWTGNGESFVNCHREGASWPRPSWPQWPSLRSPSFSFVHSSSWSH